MIASGSNHLTLQGSNYVDPSGGVVASAKLLANAVITAMADHDQVIIDLNGLRAISSSYFNLVLTQIVQAHGATALNSRVRFVFASSAQKSVFDRSLQAVLLQHK